MSLITDRDEVSNGYEPVELPSDPVIRTRPTVTMFRRRAARPSRRAVLHVQVTNDPPVPSDLVSWYTERGFHFYVAGLRWKAQVNENVKRLAFAATQPELCHNEVCGWAESSKQVAAGMCLVTLRNDSEHPQVGRRFDIVSDIIRPWVSDVIEVRAQGDGDLAQLFDLTYFGDYVSLWLAADAGIDPGPIDVLMWMKKQLSGLPEGGKAL